MCRAIMFGSPVGRPPRSAGQWRAQVRVLNCCFGMLTYLYFFMSARLCCKCGRNHSGGSSEPPFYLGPSNSAVSRAILRFTCEASDPSIARPLHQALLSSVHATVDLIHFLCEQQHKYDSYTSKLERASLRRRLRSTSIKIHRTICTAVPRPVHQQESPSLHLYIWPTSPIISKRRVHNMRLLCADPWRPTDNMTPVKYLPIVIPYNNQLRCTPIAQSPRCNDVDSAVMERCPGLETKATVSTKPT